ncbi:hypothetical protein EV193_11927 [Herbihabitans rhizosphaerae]|uniref:Sensory transduction regulator n=1 Tax=Herbihabitans rhizosphaerae TaxID=1872711 RepID=A0A4Q7KBU9_9PSEU|nr:hypothetical protein [Herbihabitans rhizosphaerae]RZS29624.1 hypothetical protein EV193_11927 [Herbihabitans rhizosphaerae]
MGQPRDSQGRFAKKWGAGAVAGVALSGTVLASGGGAAVSSGAASAGSPLAQNAARARTAKAKARTDKGKSSARKGDRDDTWRRSGLKKLQDRTENHLLCAAVSYDEVREFFLRNRCKSLDRFIVTLQDGGDTIVVAVAWVEMNTSRDARKLQDLIDKDGTGNILPKTAALLGAPHAKFDGADYDSTRTRVTIAEAATVTGSPDEELLEALAEMATLFPKP